MPSSCTRKVIVSGFVEVTTTSTTGVRWGWNLTAFSSTPRHPFHGGFRQLTVAACSSSDSAKWIVVRPNPSASPLSSDARSAKGKKLLRSVAIEGAFRYRHMSSTAAQSFSTPFCTIAGPRAPLAPTGAPRQAVPRRTASPSAATALCASPSPGTLPALGAAHLVRHVTKADQSSGLLPQRLVQGCHLQPERPAGAGFGTHQVTGLTWFLRPPIWPTVPGFLRLGAIVAGDQIQKWTDEAPSRRW